MLDEIQVIKIFQDKFGVKNFEDVEKFKVGRENFIVKVDTLVESTDVPPGMSKRQAARKAVVGTVSDFAAKGVTPKYGIISINLPVLSKKKIQEISFGIKNAARKYQIKFLGGDTNQGKELVITVCLFGTSKKIVKRGGAQKGEVIYSTGPFGYAASGLEILLNKKKSDKSFKKKAVDSVLGPKARLEFCKDAARYFTSSMDSSDGLSATLNGMARQSRSKFVIERAPANKDVIEFAKRNNLDWKRLVFDGGEEYEVLFTIPKNKKAHLNRLAKRHKISLYEIGHVSKGNGVVFEGKKVPDRGWRHFS